MSWEFGLLVVLLLWIIREVRRVGMALFDLCAFIRPVSEHFRRIDAEERKARLTASFAEYEQESYTKFMARAEKEGLDAAVAATSGTHSEAAPIGSWRKAWLGACKAARVHYEHLFQRIRTGL